MATKLTRDSDTQVTLLVTAEDKNLKKIKQEVLKRLQPEVSAPGFRKGKVPLNVVEKHVDAAHLEREYLDEALTNSYRNALVEHELKPLGYPQIKITKQVLFDTLEYEAVVEVMPPVKLSKYKGMKKKVEEEGVTKDEVEKVIENIQLRLAEKKVVKTAAKDGDEATIDFVGFDEKEEKIEGGSGEGYPLALGSGTFIPGFEENVVGMKAGEDKTFEIDFPKDYMNKALSGKKAKFTVTVKEVREVVKPKVDAELAKKAGPFTSVKELKEDIEKQLGVQKNSDLTTKLKNEIVEEIATKSKFTLPESLVTDRIESLKQEQIQNLVYRGITWDEFLAQENTTEEKYREEVLRPEAELRTKIGITLSEVAEQEKIEVTPEELEVRVQVMKGQYQNPEMQAQLDTPEVQRELLQQMMSEKTVDYLYKENVSA